MFVFVHTFVSLPGLQVRNFIIYETLLPRSFNSQYLCIRQIRPLFAYFLFFSSYKYSTDMTIKDKSLDGMEGTQIWGGRMVGADESTEL